MTTNQIQDWVWAAIKLSQTDGVTLDTAFYRLRPSDASPGDTDLGFKLLSSAQRRRDKARPNTHDPLLAECKQLNDDALSKVLLETGATLNASTFRQWRPTVRAIGAIEGVSQVHATILATDGNLGLFTDENGHFFGHVQQFSGKVKTLFTITKDGFIEQGDGSSGPKASRKPRVKKKPAWAVKADELMKELGLD